MNVVFKIFGAPYVFDLYSRGDAVDKNEQRYFQVFDQRGGEKKKFIIHRQRDKVSYSYIRYDFKSSGSRPNSFLGMSVVFQDAYCVDVETLYKIFETVFDDQKDKKIFSQHQEGETVYYKFKIGKFDDVSEEVERIGRIITNNINKLLKEDTFFLHTTQTPQEQPKTIRIGFGKKGNANQRFEELFQEYSWIYFSEEEGDVKLLSPQEIYAIKEQINDIRKSTTALAIKVLEKENVKSEVQDRMNRLKGIQQKIQPYLQHQPELQKIEQESKEELVTLGKLIIGGGNPPTPPPPTPRRFTSPPRPSRPSRPSPSPPRPSPSPPRPSSSPRFIAMGVVLLLLIVGLYSLRNKFIPNPIVENNGDSIHIAKGDTCLAQNPLTIAAVDSAIHYYSQMEDGEQKKLKMNHANDELDKLILDVVKKAKEVFDGKGKGKGIDRYWAAIDLLDQKVPSTHKEHDSIVETRKYLSDSTIRFYVKYRNEARTKTTREKYEGYILEVNPDYGFSTEQSSSSNPQKGTSNAPSPAPSIQKNDTKKSSEITYTITITDGQNSNGTVTRGQKITLKIKADDGSTVPKGKWAFDENVTVFSKSLYAANPITMKYLPSSVVENRIVYYETTGGKKLATSNIKLTNKIY